MKALYILSLAFLALSLVWPRWSLAQSQLSLQELEKEFGAYVTELSELDKLKNPDQITAIAIQNDQIKTLPSGLSRFPNLRKLIIYSVQLNDLTGIEQLSKLEYLDLDGNHSLEILPVGLAKLPHLRVLDLSNTAVRTPMEVLSQLKKLEKLLLVGISDLEVKGIGSLAKLEHLEFYLSNEMNASLLPAELGKLTGLKHLNIHSSLLGIDNLKDMIMPLGNLEYLALSSFKYKEPPVFLTNLTKLKHLKISGGEDNLLMLTDWLDKMQTLENLELGYVWIDASSAPVLGKLKNLKDLYIKMSKISTFPLLPNGLKRLHLFGNDSLRAIPKEIGKYTELEYLRLFNMPINSLPKEIGELHNLETLDLCGLELTTVPKEIGQLKKLKTLRLFSNHNLSTVPTEITNLSELQYFWLSHNENLKELPAACWQHPKLQYLSIKKTAISQIPAEVSTYKYENQDKKLSLRCAQTPLASQVEQLRKDFPNLDIVAE